MFIKCGNKLASVIISLLSLYYIILVYMFKAIILLKQELYTGPLNVKIVTKTALNSGVSTANFIKTNKQFSAYIIINEIIAKIIETKTLFI